MGEATLLNLRPWFPSVKESDADDEGGDCDSQKPDYGSDDDVPLTKVQTEIPALHGAEKELVDHPEAKDEGEVEHWQAGMLSEGAVLSERLFESLPYAADECCDELIVLSLSIEPVHGKLVAVGGRLRGPEGDKPPTPRPEQDAGVGTAGGAKSGDSGADDEQQEAQGGLMMYALTRNTSIVRAPLKESQKPFRFEVVGEKPRGQLIKHGGPVNCIAFSPDGRLLAASGAERRRFEGASNSRRSIKVFNVNVYAVLEEPDAATEKNRLSAAPLYTLPHPSEVLCCAWSPLYTRTVLQKRKHVQVVCVLTAVL